MFINLFIGASFVAMGLSDQKFGIPCDGNSNFCRSEVLLATEKGDSRGLMKLWLRGADLDTFSNDGQRPLHMAVEQNDAGIMDALIKADTLVNIPNIHGYSPLQFAAKKGRDEHVMLLRVAEADLDLKYNNDITALHIAIMKGFPKVVEALIKEDSALPKAANINVQSWVGHTPLHYAVLYNQKECLLALLKAGADFTIPTIWNQTPYMLAEATKNSELAAILNQAQENSKK